jgi:hypothetical protein
MQLTESSIRKIIKEELQKVLFESSYKGSITKPKGDEPPFGLSSQALRAIARRYRTNEQDPGPVGESNTIDSVISGLVDIGANYEEVNKNWRPFLNNLLDWSGTRAANAKLKKFKEFERKMLSFTPEGRAEYKADLAADAVNSPEARQKRLERDKLKSFKQRSTVGTPNTYNQNQIDRMAGLAERKHKGIKK